MSKEKNSWNKMHYIVKFQPPYFSLSFWFVLSNPKRYGINLNFKIPISNSKDKGAMSNDFKFHMLTLLNWTFVASNWTLFTKLISSSFFCLFWTFGVKVHNISLNPKSTQAISKDFVLFESLSIWTPACVPYYNIEVPVYQS